MIEIYHQFLKSQVKKDAMNVVMDFIIQRKKTFVKPASQDAQNAVLIIILISLEL